MEDITEMVRQADAQGFMPEVIYSFYKMAAAGHSIEESCACALAEWDI